MTKAKTKEAVQKKKSASGMWFWLPGTRRGAPPEFRKADVPFPKDGEPARYENMRIMYHGRPLAFVGKKFIDDKEVAKYLIQHGNIVDMRWDEEEAKAFGIHGDITPAKPARARPNFHLMNQPEILAYANDEGFFLDRDLPKDKLVEALEEKFKERKSNE